ncbi:MAG: hypothetical protein ACTHMU_01875 [Thermomicrobiales bacterium]
MSFFEQSHFAGTPEEAVAQARALVAAGFQYLIFGMAPSDRETLRLTDERVIPAVVGGSRKPAAMTTRQPSPQPTSQRAGSCRRTMICSRRFLRDSAVH